jgi:two-component system response regulator FixJ
MPGPVIYVVDDQQSVRDALSEMLSVFGFETGKFESADAFLQALDPSVPACIVADVRMPGTDGIELVRRLADRNISLPVILISGHADIPMAVAAIKAGAEEFIEKPVDDTQLVAAINRGLARMHENLSSSRSHEELRERFARLTPRQTEIFKLVAEGLTSQNIAEKLGISVRTVESYRAEIMEKMQAQQVIMIDLVLAGDNAIVIGLAAAGLPKEQRNKAILIGIIAATVLRICFALITDAASGDRRPVAGRRHPAAVGVLEDVARTAHAAHGRGARRRGADGRT